MTRRVDRRDFLATLGSAGAVGLAGCSDLGPLGGSSGPSEVTLETDYSLPITYRMRVRIETEEETISGSQVMERKPFFLNLNEEEHQMPTYAYLLVQKETGGNKELGAYITADGETVASSVTSTPYGVAEVDHSF